MDAVVDEWEKVSSQPFNATQPYVVFTTESRSIIQDQKDYGAQQPELRFATNIHDVAPDSGRGVSSVRGQVDADTAMIASLATLKLQMIPRMTLGNCCSGFHQLIYFFRNGGLGTSDALESPVFRCLQEMENPHHRVCCWKGPGCMEEKMKDMILWNQLHNVTINGTVV
jgi:hypothetical protein